MGGSKKVTVGYRYFLGMHIAMTAGPVDKLTQIRFDDKVAWTGDSSGGEIVVAAPDLFGGEKREGGVVGILNFNPGGPAQGQDSYLLSKLTTLVPNFRGVACAVLKQMYLGMNPYLKRPSFRLQRIHLRQDGIEQWYDEKAEIGSPLPDMNPAHIIRECLTDPDWGMGYPEEDIDDDAFTYAADLLYDEGMGISLLWDAQMEIREFVSEILKHIDGSVYINPANGKFTLKLVRDDYSEEDLIDLTEDNVEKVTDFKRAQFGELVTSVTVGYFDTASNTKGSVSFQDIALERAQGAMVNTTIQYPGFTKTELATRVAQRDQKALGSQLATCTVYADSTARNLLIGDVFLLTWDDEGLDQTVMRVTGVAKGDGKNNQIRIQCAEDVFALDDVALTTVDAPIFEDPVTPAEPMVNHIAFEVPYLELVQQEGQANIDTLLSHSPEAGFVGAAGQRAGSAINADMYVDAGSGYVEGTTLDFCPIATLGEDLDQLTATFAITDVDTIDNITAGTWFQMGTEIMRVDVVSTSSITVGRGCLDTVPVAHTSGELLYFWDDFGGADSTQYVEGESLNVKLLTVTGASTLAIGDAPVDNVVMGSRAARPYAPGNLQVNEEYFPEFIGGQLALTWAHRDRLQQTSGTIFDFTDSDIGPEAGTTYTVRVYNNDVLMHTESGIATAFYTYPYPDELTDGGIFDTLTFTLYAVRDSLESYQGHSVSVSRVNVRVTEYDAKRVVETGSDTRICDAPTESFYRLDEAGAGNLRLFENGDRVVDE